MIWWIWAAGVAHAGCVVDTGREARQAAAELVVVGTIAGLELAEDDSGDLIVYQRLRVETAYEGKVKTGEIRLRSGSPGGFCAADRVYAPGQRVFAIGTPDAAQAIPVSPCHLDVGEVSGDEAWLAETAARDRANRTFPGVKQLVTSAHAPLPAGIGIRSRTLEGIEGELVRDEGSTLSALFEVDDLLVLDRISEASLQRVLAKPVPILPGAALMWWPGVQVGANGEVAVTGNIEAQGVVGAADTADRWKPHPSAPPEGTSYYVAHPTALRATPDGPDVAQMKFGTLVGTGPAVDGWKPVWLDTEELAGAAWVRESDLHEGGTGYGSGYGSSAHILRIDLPAGVDIRAPSGPSFARTLADTTLQWVAGAGDQLWVVVDAPSGPKLGEVTCDASWPKGCEPR